MRKYLLAFLVLAILLTGCADATDVSQCIAEPNDAYGFWGGLWHGLTVFFNLISQLWWDDVTIYAENNTGGWYDFGFWLGACMLGTGTGRASKRD